MAQMTIPEEATDKMIAAGMDALVGFAPSEKWGPSEGDYPGLDYARQRDVIQLLCPVESETDADSCVRGLFL